ncbi:MAG TPA: penicillin-binding protein 2, partial [Burkholderiales bacterium]|nr:penicillin-binding protein 2 [Burkholderiales bacterium]
MSFAELRNYDRELRAFQLRLGLAGLAVLLAFGLLLARFVWLQVLQYDAYSAKAEENRIAIVPLPPDRGLVLDRNGEVLARNYLAYTLEIFPAQVRDLEATIAELAAFVD